MERMTVNNALARLAKENQFYTQIFEHGVLSLEIYKPQKCDLQQPHKQDEIYVVVSGSGYFVLEESRSKFEPGEVIFVPAGVAHRFEDFTEDFVTWVIFFGDQNGIAS